VWTLVGCLGFLGVILASDPASLTDMPEIKGAFLTLMGLSSAGYLAGKLVRAPGPIIELLTIEEVIPAVSPNLGVMKIKVKGQNLTDSAVVKVDNKELRITEYEVQGLTSQDQPAGGSYFTVVDVVLKNAEQYRTGTHVLYLVNDDGQSACESFPMNPMAVNAVGDLQAGTNPVTVNLTGRNFAAGISVNWTPPGGAMQAIPTANLTVVNDGQMNVSLVPGTATGTGTLTLATPVNLLVNVPVAVKS